MKLRILFIALFLSLYSFGQINISGGSTITENFDGLGMSSIVTYTNNVTLSGWYITSTALPVNNGGINSNSCYNFGTTGTSDRALGAISTSTTHRFGVRLTNNGGNAISSFDISFTGEQWRAFTAGVLVFEYQTGTTVTSLTTGTWTPVTALDFSSLVTSAGTSTDGNNTSFRTVKSANVAVSVVAGSEIFFRWTRAGTSSPGLAIDDLSITANATCTTPPNPTGSITGTTSACTSTTLTYTGTAAATSYWQTSATGTSTTNSASSTYAVAASGTYYVRNYVGSCWSTGSVASLAIVITNNPAITTQPIDRSIIAGNNTTFAVVATNAGSYQWQVSTDGGGTYTNVTNTGVYTGATSATLTITGATLGMNGYKYLCIISPINPCTTPVTTNLGVGNNLAVTPVVSYASDIITGGSESATIASTINNITISTSTDGARVWEFLVRDGGAASNDADAFPTYLTSLIISQNAGNAVGIWSDAIYSIGLFDGTTLIANGVVTANQIQFTGINVTVADDTQKRLTLRLSLKCPLGSGAIDGDDFVFTISKANVTFSASGSGITTGALNTNSVNGQNVIAVVANRLLFTTNPTSTGINAAMGSVIVKAVDACGNVDLNFTGSIALTSSGSMNAVIPINAVAGSATFTGIIHTVLGTGLTLTATSTGLTTAVSTLFNITPVTIFSEGDFAVIGVNSNINCLGYASGNDEISFITFKDIQNGDVFYITDNGYEHSIADRWGTGEGVYQITRNGGTIPAGTVITFRFLTNSMEFNSPDTAWTFARAAGFTGNVNMNGNGDQIFFMQGGTWNNGGTNNATYTPGTLLYAFNTGTTWTPLVGSSQHSALPLALQCFNMMPGGASDFLEYIGPTTATFKFDWIARLNDPSNWADRVNCAGYTRMHAGQTYTISPDISANGVWTGTKSTDWFDCANWQRLKVPDATTDVVVGSTYATKDAVIDVIANATNAAIYSNTAESKDLTISAASRKVQLESNINNLLEVRGNVLITNTAGNNALDMDDSNATTVDGLIRLYGNWTNNAGDTAFSEGNGTVHLLGSTPQIISSAATEGTETFYNVILDNNFDTAVSNDLIASGDLTITSGKVISIDSNGYIKAYKKLDHNGDLTIEDNGQLIQVDETDTNVGTYSASTFKVKRLASVNRLDYVYWSSPTNNVFDMSNVPSNSLRYEWNTTYANANGTQGNWRPASGNMLRGKGYAIGVPSSSPLRPSPTTDIQTTFTGRPNNGQFTFQVTRGAFDGADYDADLTNPNNVLTTRYDDNWNLVGNPYPSAIDAEKFLVANQSTIEGAVWIWKHGLAPNSSVNPFYANFAYNYSSTDYIKYNGLGSTEPDTFAGVIASGQGFMVNMLHSAATPGTITFNNNLRSVGTNYTPYDNSDFFRLTASEAGIPEEKHRMWLDIINDTSGDTDRTLLGYSTSSTLDIDHFYDCIFVPRSQVSLYSVINNDSFIIQGRPLPFDVNDRVPMGINIIAAGSHTIAIKKVDGLFSNQINIYIEDKALNIIHNLREAPYRFNSEKGIFNDRFIVRYTNSTLGNPDFENLENSVVIATNHGEMTIKSQFEAIDEVTVYDILGRQLLESKNIGNNNFVASNISTSQQALIVKIKLANGLVVTRKIIL